MKTQKTILSIFVLLMLCSCEFSVGSGNKTADNLKTVSESINPIRNAVEFREAGGLKVESAFLMKDNGELVPENNTLKAGDRFNLVLKLSGWQADNGKVLIGAAERLTNSNREVMLKEDDLFANTAAVSAEDAEVITLIMEVLNTETIYDFYQTEFEVWNKNKDQSVHGAYRFQLRK
ncbi:MAG: hypothetical protein WBF83_09430 [Moheibacter sp.]